MNKDIRESFDALVHSAVTLTAVIWKSYLTSNDLWEQLDSITDFAMYVLLVYHLT